MTKVEYIKVLQEFKNKALEILDSHKGIYKVAHYEFETEIDREEETGGICYGDIDEVFDAAMKFIEIQTKNFVDCWDFKKMDSAQINIILIDVWDDPDSIDIAYIEPVCWLERESDTEFNIVKGIFLDHT